MHLQEEFYYKQIKVALQNTTAGPALIQSFYTVFIQDQYILCIFKLCTSILSQFFHLLALNPVCFEKWNERPKPIYTRGRCSSCKYFLMAERDTQLRHSYHTSNEEAEREAPTCANTFHSLTDLVHRHSQIHDYNRIKMAILYLNLYILINKNLPHFLPSET